MFRPLETPVSSSAMVQAISSWPLNMEDQVLSSATPFGILEFVVSKMALEQVFLQKLQYSPVIIILPKLHNHLVICH